MVEEPAVVERCFRKHVLDHRMQFIVMCWARSTRCLIRPAAPLSDIGHHEAQLTSSGSGQSLDIFNLELDLIADALDRLAM